MWGNVFFMPKFAPDTESKILFGPGVSAVTIAKVVKDKILESSKTLSCRNNRNFCGVHEKTRTNAWEKCDQLCKPFW